MEAGWSKISGHFEATDEAYGDVVTLVVPPFIVRSTTPWIDIVDAAWDRATSVPGHERRSYIMDNECLTEEY